MRSLRNRRLNAEAFPHHVLEGAKLEISISANRACSFLDKPVRFRRELFETARRGIAPDFHQTGLLVIRFIHVVKARVQKQVR